MSLLDPLLEIQDLDLAADAARARSESLAERTALPILEKAIAELDTQLAAGRAERTERQAEEEQLAGEVSQLARDIETAEVLRYSGKRKDQEEAVLHEESQTLLRTNQARLEERELELLETIEELENRIGNHESAHVANRKKFDEAEETVRKVEAEVAVALQGLAESRVALADRMPGDRLAAYDRVRAQPRTAGRGAALLSESRCTGCRIKLPSLEVTRMLAQPEEALIQCPQCRRVLVCR